MLQERLVVVLSPPRNDCWVSAYEMSCDSTRKTDAEERLRRVVVGFRLPLQSDGQLRFGGLWCERCVDDNDGERMRYGGFSRLQVLKRKSESSGNLIS